MSRETKLIEISELAKLIKKDIPITRYIRQRIVQEEIIDAYQSPVPSSVMINGKQKMVEIGDWIVVKEDGSQNTYKSDEFFEIFEPYIPEQIESSSGSKNDRRK